MSLIPFKVPDITMFFASMSGNKRKPDPTQRSQRIESGSVGEEEYESLYAQYFPQTQDRTGNGIECRGCGGSCIVAVVVEAMDILGD